MARPKVPIDGEEVYKLASLGLTQIEIADVLGASNSTICRRFAKEWTKGHATLKRSLRRKQTEVALSGNVTMLIWLGKNMLGQADKQEVEHSGSIAVKKAYVTISPDEWDQADSDVQPAVVADQAVARQVASPVTDG